jgi:hypothetical protein
VSSKHSTQVPSGVTSPYNIEGKVEGGGAPIAKATVTLWAAGLDEPQKLAETQSKDNGRFDLKSAGRRDDTGVQKYPPLQRPSRRFVRYAARNERAALTGASAPGEALS